MSTPVIDATLVGYRPGNESTLVRDASYTIPVGAIESITVSERAGKPEDDARVTIRNTADAFTGMVDHGDRLTVLGRCKRLRRFDPL